MTAKLDASATIYLGKANLLTLAARVCGGLLITASVYEETVVRGQEAGHRDAGIIAKAIQDRLIRVVPLTEASRRRLDQARFPSRLGNGEQESRGAEERRSRGDS
jgi:hypothetical protein